MSKITDPIADYLTRLRNGIKANHRIVDVPASNLKKAITEVLFDKGYILNYKFDEASGPQGTIKIALKYHPTTKLSAIKELKRVSKPGLRQYRSAEELPRVLNGLGIAIVSTSNGVMTDKEARVQNVGGEVLCFVS
jgi:small subunit ribosomal protein S8